ncbi:UNVERIFIED_ORG: hypothetical protein ABIB19_003831 [Arthrobacter sp. UYEF10]
MVAAVALRRIMRLGSGTVHDIGEVTFNLGLSRPPVVNSFFSGTGTVQERSAAGLSLLLFAQAIPDSSTRWPGNTQVRTDFSAPGHE